MSKLPRFFATLAATLLAAGSASAASYYWDGGASNVLTLGNGVSDGGAGTWNKSILNWDVGTGPHLVWSDGNTAEFAGASGLVDLGAPITAAGVNFRAGGYSLSASGANTLTLAGAGGIRTTTGTTTVNGPLILNQGNTAQTWTVAFGSTLDFTGNVSQGPAATGNATALIIAGGGTVNYSGSGSTFAGATVIQFGLLSLTGASSSALGVLGGTSSITVPLGGSLVLNSPANDVLGRTAGVAALVIDGSMVSNNGPSVHVTLANTVTMTGGILGGIGAGDANGVFVWATPGGGLNATSASNAAAATVEVRTSLQADTVFNVVRGTAATGINPDLTVSGVLQDYAGAEGKSFTEAGSGFLLLTGANTYSGSTFIQGGRVRLGTATALGSTAGGTAVSSTGTLDLNAQNLGGEAITVAGAGSDGNGALVSISGTDQANALRFVTLSGDATFGGTGRWDVRASPTATLDMGGHTLTKTGNNVIGLAALSSPVANPGHVVVNQGTIALEGDTNLGGTAADTFTVNHAATLQVLNQTLANAWTLKLNDATFDDAGGSTGWAGPVQLTGANTVHVAQDAVATFSGAITGPGGFSKTDSGSLLLSGAGSYTGPVNILGGMLQAGGVNVLASASSLTLAAGTVLDLRSNPNAVGSLAGEGTVTLGSATLTVGGDNSNATAGGALSGPGGLVKTGSGTQTLAGLSTYSGATTVKSGTLEISGSLLGTTAVKVAGGRLLLSADGAVNSADADTTLNTGATLALAGTGHSSRFGALTVTGPVTVDFGTGSSDTLTFDSLAAFTGTLQVLNWTGSLYAAAATDGGSTVQDRLLFEHLVALTPAQLADIRFYSDSGATFLGPAKETAYANGFELVPVPEPGPLTALLSTAALLVFARRITRRL